MPQLKLLALDEEDLGVISSQLQDAVVRVGELAYQKSAKRFAMVANRFNWMQAERAGQTRVSRNGQYERRQAALRFDRVRGARLQGIDLSDTRRVMSLLAVQFAPSAPNAPDGVVSLVFSGGCAIALDVECIECEMRDLGAAWTTTLKPVHPDAD